MADTAPLVIVGTGLAGYNLAKEFRKLDSQRPMLLVSADDGRFYSKPLLSTGFAKGKEADELAMQDASAMAAQLGAEVLTGVSVSAIDPAARTLTLGDRQQAYSDLVLALGAEVRALPWREQLGERLLSINDLADYGRFRAALTGRKKVLIIGAGLIGCEFANDLSLGGFEVTVVATDPWVMPQLLPEPVAAALQRRLEALQRLFPRQDQQELLLVEARRRRLGARVAGIGGHGASLRSEPDSMVPAAWPSLEAGTRHQASAAAMSLMPPPTWTGMSRPRTMAEITSRWTGFPWTAPSRSTKCSRWPPCSCHDKAMASGSSENTVS